MWDDGINRCVSTVAISQKGNSALQRVGCSNGINEYTQWSRVVRVERIADVIADQAGFAVAARRKTAKNLWISFAAVNLW